MIGCSSDDTQFSSTISPPTIIPSPSPTPSQDPEMGPEPDLEPTALLSLRRIASGLSDPLYLTSPPNDARQLFILEQRTGNILILDRDTGRLNPSAFLKVPASDLIATGFEQGLLGLAFHPEFASNGTFYINYTAPGKGEAGQTKLVEYRTFTPDLADPASARTILTIPQPEQNHNGGWIGFGPDGYLYWATGDGGGLGFLPSGIATFASNSQDISDNLLGKVLRIDVDGDDFPEDPERNYRIPPDNPFVGSEGDDEIWVYGLRNPWRASFDPLTGDLYIGDVGQNQREEINIQPSSSPGGENYGWNVREGSLVLDRGSNPPNLQNPTYEFDHSEGKSVTGGYVYRGPNPDIDGRYFFGIFSTPSFGPSQILSLQFAGSTAVDIVDHTPDLQTDVGNLDMLGSFGRDAEGNIYALDLLDGDIFQLVVRSVTPGAPEPDIP